MKTKQFYQYTFYENGDVINNNTCRPIKKHYNKNTSCEIRLSINKKQRSFIYTRLYYYLFVEEFDLNNRDLCVQIKDGNIYNITKDNLELKTRKELLTDDSTRRFKVSHSSFKELKNLNKESCNYKELARVYGCSPSNIGKIIRGINRKGVT